MPLLLVSFTSRPVAAPPDSVGLPAKVKLQRDRLSLDIARITLNSISVVGYRVGRVRLDFEAGSERITRKPDHQAGQPIAG